MEIAATEQQVVSATKLSSASTFLENERALLRLIQEDWQTNFRDWTQPGFRALAVHRFGTWVQQLRWRPLRVVLRRVHTSLYRYARNHYGVELPVTAVIGRRVVFGHQSCIVIHANAVIGDDCFLRQNVTLGVINAERGSQAPTLGRGVVLGCGAVILGGVTIGDRATIGPNAVVITDVPADTAVFPSTPRMITPPNPAATLNPDADALVAGSRSHA